MYKLSKNYYHNLVKMLLSTPWPWSQNSSHKLDILNQVKARFSMNFKDKSRSISAPNVQKMRFEWGYDIHKDHINNTCFHWTIEFQKIGYFSSMKYVLLIHSCELSNNCQFVCSHPIYWKSHTFLPSSEEAFEDILNRLGQWLRFSTNPRKKCLS